MTGEQQERAIQLLKKARGTLNAMHGYGTDVYREIYEFLEEVNK